MGRRVTLGAEALPRVVWQVLEADMTLKESEIFAGLDVSMAQTSVCLVDASGALVWRGVCATDT